MTPIWVDTDFGFDDLWALLLLRHLGCPIAGVSLVAGNAPLPQVERNAQGAQRAYGLDWPFWSGADRPLHRPQETAARILGPTGMRSRGATLPKSQSPRPAKGAVEALRSYLTATEEPRQILALGPLTNIALMLQDMPEMAGRITRLVWMGGSAGAGNHTARAEFNALADAEALAIILAADIPLDMVDLTFCRQVTFGPDDLPETDPLTRDLLGGYLDIALERGRAGMAIYDPLAALAIARPDAISFAPCQVDISTEPDETYGETRITPAKKAMARIAIDPPDSLAATCLNALEGIPAHGP